MKVGIVGLPNVGKSTLFKALTKNPVDINNYPFCTIEPNVGVVAVPDERVDKLAELSKSAKKIPTVIRFVDIAGLVKGASEGEGLGNKFLSNIREVDVIVHVVRVFRDSNITHISGEVNPLKDIEIVNTELILADLDTVKKRIAKLEKEARGMDKEAAKKLGATKKIAEILNNGKLAGQTSLDKEEAESVKDLQLLTFKPILYAFNTNDFDKGLPAELADFPHVLVDMKMEEELNDMSAEELKELGVSSNLSELVRQSYKLLDLITFLTTGEDETRAWTVKNGSSLPQAGAAIHTDFLEKFICGMVINWEDLIHAGGWAQAREKGVLRTEGKEYIVQDGDVIEFKI